MKRVLAGGFALLSMTGCPRDSAHKTPKAAPAPDAVASPEASIPVAAGAEHTARPLPLSLWVEAERDGLGLHVAVVGDERVELSPSVQVQALGESAQALGESSAWTLRTRCRSQGCITLAPGGELVAPPWLGQLEGERCGAPFRPERPGDYRVVVRSCDGRQKAVGQFHWAGP